MEEAGAGCGVGLLVGDAFKIIGWIACHLRFKGQLPVDQDGIDTVNQQNIRNAQRRQLIPVVIVSLSEILEIDNSLNELAELPIGFGAFRDGEDKDWNWFEIKD